MDRESIEARIAQEVASLRGEFPRVSDCRASIEPIGEGAAARYAAALDLRWPEHQSLISVAPAETAEAALSAAFLEARRRLASKPEFPRRSRGQ